MHLKIKHPFELLPILSTQDYLGDVRITSESNVPVEYLTTAMEFRAEILKLKPEIYLRNLTEKSPAEMIQVARRWSGNLTEVRSSALPGPQKGPSDR